MSGPIPPVIPTQFTADDATIAVPAANNLNVFSRDIVTNFDNGIRTTADPNLSDNLYVQLTNRQTGTVTTNDATITTIITFALPAQAGTYYVYGNIQAYSTNGPSGGAFSFSGGYLTDGITAVELGTEFHDTFQTVSFEPADIFLSPSGNNVLVTVQGIVGFTIDWNALLEFRQVN